MKTSVLFLCLWLMGSAAQAQEQAKPLDPGPQTIHIIETQHVEPGELLSQVKSLLREISSRATVDERTGRLIVIGPAEELARWDEIAAVIDVPAGPTKGPSQTVILPVRHRPASSLREALQTALFNGQLVVDSQRNLLVVRSEPDQVEAARRLLESLDIAPASARLDIQTLAPGGKPIAEQKIRQEIERLALGEYGVSMTAGVRTVEGERFTMVSKNRDGGQLEVQGELRFLSQNEEVEIRLEVEVTEGGPEGSHAGIGTTLRVPIGEHVIVGLSPRGASADQAPLILVLRATRVR